MSHGYEPVGVGPLPATELPGVLAPVARAVAWLNRVILGMSMLALLAACLILSGSVFLRYFLKIPTDWQDEMAVFLLVGAIFCCGAYVQSQRGHIGIEAIAGLLSPAVNRARLLFCDVCSFAFCSFFTWKSWTLWHEAFVDGQTTSSSWAPPLWIPYGLMALGMTMLSLQILLQIVASFTNKESVK